ncbi:MAG: hypothetical protein LCH41_15255 [Armatimonadetes bacterium]|nr:hypothetical protein [Armatimonadota bacterium]
MKQRRKVNKREKGVAMIVSFALLSLVMAASTAYIDQSTQAIRMARLTNYEARGSWLCDAAVQDIVAQYWKDFKINQNFNAMDTAFTGASVGAPKAGITGTQADVGKYAAAVIDYSKAANNQSRAFTIRAVGYLDQNNNNVADSNEPRKTIDVRISFGLKRSQVFDYAQFVNNYGWVKGFTENNMIVNGDWRVNGDFDLISGTATINGSVIAASNNKLTPAAIGLVNKTPYKWDQSKYDSHLKTNKSWHNRMRPAYDPAIHGAPGSAEFDKWRDLVFMSEATMVNGRPFGSTVQDSAGVRSWKRTSPWAQYKTLDENPTSEIVMPDLSDFGSPSDSANIAGKQFARSKAWRNTQATFLDGSANPNFNGNGNSTNETLPNGDPNPNYSGAYVDVWDASKNKYVRVSSNGVVNGSALLIGTSSKPIRIHGPVTINGDVAIGGVVDGQGTLYANRNIHIISSVRYKDAPDFKGTSLDQIDKQNSKRDFLGMAARGSVMIGDPEQFSSHELDHMVPPFTKARKDELGNTVPAFNAKETDPWGLKRYESLIQKDDALKAAFKAEAVKGVNQIDGIVYTNNMVGGQVGYEGGGLTINGSMVCKDQAVVAYSGPITMNYDTRIKDRGDDKEPLIDLDLPRGPSVEFLSWQDRGFKLK